MVDYYSLSVVIFFVILGFIMWRDRKNIEHKYFIFYKRKTKRGQRFIESVVKISPRFWRALGTVAIALAFFMMFYGIYQLLVTIKLLLERTIVGPGIRLLLPFPGPNPVGGFGFIGIPFWFWIIILAVILFPHEFFHGILARAEKIKIRSVGVFLLAIFPGAFVDPDEKEFKKSKLLTKLRVVAAGAFANFLVAGIVFALTSFLLWPNIVGSGVLIKSVNQTAPAGLVANITEGSILQEINGLKIAPSYTDYFMGYFGLLVFTSGFTTDVVNSFAAGQQIGAQLTKYKAGDKIQLLVSGKVYDIVLDKNPRTPELPYIGITPALNSKFDANIFSVLLPLLSLSILLSFLVGIVNILPIYPLDGGVFVKSITDKFFPKTSATIVSVVTWIVLSLILLTVVIPLTISAFPFF